MADFSKYTQGGGLKATAKIIPTHHADTYPTHIDVFGYGGYKVVESIEMRDAIPVERLCLGSVVKVANEEGQTEYYVTSIPEKAKTGKDCTWKINKAGEVDLEQLSQYIKLDNENKVPLEYSRGVIFRGVYDTNTEEFKTANGNNITHKTDAVYIDDNTGFVYSYANNKFVRDTLYWINV